MLVSATAMAQVILYGSYTMWLVMPYLTEVWGISIARAAAVVNIFDGVVAILPLGLKIILESLGHSMMGNYCMLLWSGISSALGLWLLTMSSTAPMFSKATAICSEYEPKCIGHTQKVTFYTGLVLLATGLATCLTSLRPYIFERAKLMGVRNSVHLWIIRQTLVHNDVPTEMLTEALEEAESWADPKKLRRIAYKWPSERCLYWCNAAFTMALIVLVFWVKPWYLRFGVSAIILLATTILFVLKPWYQIYQVFPDELLSHIPDFRQKREHPLVIKAMAKSLIRNFPMWSSFLICGLVSSVGNTYFIEQAGQMNQKLGGWKVSTVFFLLLYKQINSTTSSICQSIITFSPNCRRVVIALALVVSCLCCVIAATNENTRLNVVKRQGLIDKPDDDSVANISMFRMIPQFVLLGVLDGAYNTGVFAFFHEQFSFPAAKKYLNSLIHFVLGLGILCNVVSVYVAGETSGKGGRQSWFQHSLNQSRLDKYYWMLALLTAINLFYYFLVDCCYSKRNNSELNPVAYEWENGDQDEDVEDLDYMRLDWFDLLPLRQ